MSARCPDLAYALVSITTHLTLNAELYQAPYFVDQKKEFEDEGRTNASSECTATEYQKLCEGSGNGGF
eukprot:1159881-Pelagomonas_calceolata.AAC.6